MISSRIKQLRKTEKLSQSSFGEKLGVSRDVINNIENNRVEINQLQIKAIIQTFKVNENWLLTGMGDMYENRSQSINQILEIYDGLNPEFQKYLLEQVKALEKLQTQQEQNK